MLNILDDAFQIKCRKISWYISYRDPCIVIRIDTEQHCIVTPLSNSLHVSVLHVSEELWKVRLFSIKFLRENLTSKISIPCYNSQNSSCLHTLLMIAIFNLRLILDLGLLPGDRNLILSLPKHCRKLDSLHILLEYFLVKRCSN